MATQSYSLYEFEKVGTNQYELPEQVLNTIQRLCLLVGYNTNTPNTYINQYNVNTSSSAPTVKSTYGEREKTYKKPKESVNEWKKPQFKATVFAEVDNTQAIINDIRSGLNKIKEENCEEKITIFLEKIEEIRNTVEFGDDSELFEKMKQVFDTVYAVCVSNKMFSKIYAKVLTRIHAKYSYEMGIFLNEKIKEYLESMKDIVDVDSNTNYDAYCVFTAKNTSRKNITNLLCEIAKTNSYADFLAKDILSAVSELIAHVLESINSASKQKEVEEITENIVIVFSHFEKEFKADFKSSFETIVAFKTGEKPGLTSRTKFKYMDMIGK